MNTCPVCSRQFEDNKAKTLELYDDRYGYPGIFELYTCLNCSHKFISAIFSSNQLTSLYTNYYPRATFALDDFLPLKQVGGFRTWLNGERRSAYCWVPERVRVLDIGCGFGESLAYHKARGCDVYGVEADDNIRRVAEKFGYNVHVGLFAPDIYQSDFFDYITMDQVIEHVVNPAETLRGIATVLKPGGIAIFSTPNANGWGAKIFGRQWINWHAPYHLQNFSKKSMHIAAVQAGLRMERICTITSSEWLHYQWYHILTIPKMGEASSFWLPTGKFTRKERLLFKMLSYLHRLKINHLITRLFDALGVGDNYLFFLRKP